MEREKRLAIKATLSVGESSVDAILSFPSHAHVFRAVKS